VLTPKLAWEKEKKTMRQRLNLLVARLMSFVQGEEGQDLVEYALIVAVIALAATSGMKTLATAVNNGFSTLGATLTNSQ
jgi:pilus assembly protein Flp/PilA